MCAIFAKDIRHLARGWRIFFTKIEPIPTGGIQSTFRLFAKSQKRQQPVSGKNKCGENGRHHKKTIIFVTLLHK